jgi:hypothetical protein
VCGPPVPVRVELRAAKISDKIIAPTDVDTHPTIHNEPNAANDRGNINAPEPIRLPVTSVVNVQKPIFSTLQQADAFVLGSE